MKKSKLSKVKQEKPKEDKQRGWRIYKNDCFLYQEFGNIPGQIINYLASKYMYKKGKSEGKKWEIDGDNIITFDGYFRIGLEEISRDLNISVSTIQRVLKKLEKKRVLTSRSIRGDKTQYKFNFEKLNDYMWMFKEKIDKVKAKHVYSGEEKVKNDDILQKDDGGFDQAGMMKTTKGGLSEPTPPKINTNASEVKTTKVGLSEPTQNQGGRFRKTYINIKDVSSNLNNTFYGETAASGDSQNVFFGEDFKEGDNSLNQTKETSLNQGKDTSLGIGKMLDSKKGATRNECLVKLFKDCYKEDKEDLLEITEPDSIISLEPDSKSALFKTFASISAKDMKGYQEMVEACLFCWPLYFKHPLILKDHEDILKVLFHHLKKWKEQYKNNIDYLSGMSLYEIKFGNSNYWGLIEVLFKAIHVEMRDGGVSTIPLALTGWEPFGFLYDYLIFKQVFEFDEKPMNEFKDFVKKRAKRKEEGFVKKRDERKEGWEKMKDEEEEEEELFSGGGQYPKNEEFTEGERGSLKSYLQIEEEKRERASEFELNVFVERTEFDADCHRRGRRTKTLNKEGEKNHD